MPATAPNWKFELILALSALIVGLLVVPLLVYLLGGLLAGDYAGDGGLRALLLSIWTDIGRGRLSGWVLLLAPYLIAQLLRLGWHLLKSGRAVTDLTNPKKYQ